MPTGPPDFYEVTVGDVETTADRIIREAMDSGDFDDLAGSGQPIPGAGVVDDEMWWVRSWLERNHDGDGREPREPG